MTEDFRKRELALGMLELNGRGVFLELLGFLQFGAQYDRDNSETTTHIHMSVIPAIAGRGDIFLDGQAHRTIYDGCMVARGQGATLRRYPTGDVEALDAMLRAAPKANTKLICTDGVNSMTERLLNLRQSGGRHRGRKTGP